MGFYLLENEKNENSFVGHPSSSHGVLADIRIATAPTSWMKRKQLRRIELGNPMYC